MSFEDRARGCLLGLALGDAYGRPLEFLKGEQVRRTPVDMRPSAQRWTDDTHMTLYVAEAILTLPPGPLDVAALGTACGRAFVRWLHDPLTPSTAPGRTCLEGAQAFEARGDWRVSGVVHSDGCGAVMRVAPVGLAFQGGELVKAARAQALVTHAHPNALEASAAGAWLVRRGLDTGRIDATDVRELIAAIPVWGLNGRVADSLHAALAFAENPGPELDIAAIPAGDGGWRSPSALGLAVAAFLTWGRNFPTLVERAARIDGDSDSVAAIAGCLAGVVVGESRLPVGWLAGIQRKEQIVALATQLIRRR